MTDANNMRSYLSVLNERDTRVNHSGTVKNDNVEYSAIENSKGELTKVVAHLKSYESGRYTKLGRNLQRLERINARVTQIKNEVKEETRELISDLFLAEDECMTRVVETVSFTFQLSKTPAPTKTYQYKKVLDELQEHLTPELLTVMKGLLNKYESTTQKAPSLKHTDKEAVNEANFKDAWDKIKTFSRKFLRSIIEWGKEYDAKLDALKAQVAMAESETLGSKYGDPVEEATPFLDGGRGDSDMKWGSLIKKGIGKATGRGAATKTNPLSEIEIEKPSWKNPIKYRGYEIYPNPSDWVTKGDEIVYHVEGWEPGDADGETGMPDTQGYHYASDIEEAKENIDDELGDLPVNEDDWGYADHIDQDDEEDTDGVYSVEEAVAKAAEQLGVEISGPNADERDVRSAANLRAELNRYGDTYTISDGEYDSINFYCADKESVNYGNHCAGAWIDEGFYWES